MTDFERDLLVGLNRAGVPCSWPRIDRILAQRWDYDAMHAQTVAALRALEREGFVVRSEKGGYGITGAGRQFVHGLGTPARVEG